MPERMRLERPESEILSVFQGWSKAYTTFTASRGQSRARLTSKRTEARMMSRAGHPENVGRSTISIVSWVGWLTD